MSNVKITELKLIAQDCNELVQLVLNIEKNSSSGEISLALSPFIALIAEESFNYLKNNEQLDLGDLSTTTLFESFFKSVTKMRARAKLFDDTKGGLETLIETLFLSQRKSSEWFLHPHGGIFGKLKRRLQPDIGIFYFEDHVFCTTHTSLLTIGLTYEQLLVFDLADNEKLRSYLHEYNVAAGAYISQVLKYLGQLGIILYADNTLDLSEARLPINHNDHYGYKVYTHVADQLSLTRPELSAALIFLDAQVNFVGRVLPHLLPSNSSLLLRATFLTAYHATSALQKLEEIEGKTDGTLAQFVHDILNDPDSSFLLQMRKTRNILAHYQLREAAEFLTPTGDPLNDILIGFCNMGREEVEKIARRQLIRISETFVEVISKTALKDTRALFGDHT